jgi:mannose-6-phosphate isomerase-like protein (cupin superfamily)
MRVWHIGEILAGHRRSERSYTEFFAVPSTHCGVYTLPKGGADDQSPHAEDEVYYVVAGRGKMESDGRKEDVKPGSLVFIAAGAQHRFVDIEEDLELLVVFSSGPVQAPPKK